MINVPFLLLASKLTSAVRALRLKEGPEVVNGLARRGGVDDFSQPSSDGVFNVRSGWSRHMFSLSRKS